MGLFPFKLVRKSSGDTLLNPRTIWSIGNDGLSIFGGVSKAQLLKWYLEVPEVNQVINTKARMFAKMNLTVRNKTTAEVVESDNRVIGVLGNPNWYQSRKEFITQDKIFAEIYGNNYIYGDYPLGFDRKATKQIFTLNPQNLELDEPSGGLPYFFRSDYKEGTKYKYTYEGKTYEITTDKVLHLNNNNSKEDKPLGLSTLEALKANIENLVAAYESRGVLLRNRGALGILSNNAKDETGAVLGFDPKDKKAIQDEYTGGYGLLKKQSQLIITNLNLRWQKMAMTPKDLMLFEEGAEDFHKICDAFGFNSQMFSSKDGATYTNAIQYEKTAYQDTIIPEAQEYIDALNGWFETENENFVIVGEFDDLPIFADDEKERANTIKLVTGSLSQQYNDKALSLEKYQKLVDEMWKDQF